jgi:hypothetical protein
MERLINSDSMVTQLWGPFSLRKPEDDGDMFSKMPVLKLQPCCTMSEKTIIIDTAVKASYTVNLLA